jgi:hypothetical protein
MSPASTAEAILYLLNAEAKKKHESEIMNDNNRRA